MSGSLTQSCWPLCERNQSPDCVCWVRLAAAWRACCSAATAKAMLCSPAPLLTWPWGSLHPHRLKFRCVCGCSPRCGMWRPVYIPWVVRCEVLLCQTNCAAALSKHVVESSVARRAQGRRQTQIAVSQAASRQTLSLTQCERFTNTSLCVSI